MGGADSFDTGGSHGDRPAAPSDPVTPRYRCTLCGNLTRFDVVERRRTRSFYHYTLGGLLTVEEEELLGLEVETVVCRWCNSPAHVEIVRQSSEEGP